MLRLYLAVIILAIQGISYAHAAEPVVAGSVLRIQGAAMANHEDSSSNLMRGTQIRVGDHIITGRNTRIALQMIDGSMLTLGENTEFAINNYHYSARAKEGSAQLELIKGVFRAITGAIGKLPGRDFHVKTSVGVIGIRGTDFWGGYLFSSSLDVALLGGAGVYVENAGGRVEISQSGYGTTVNSADIAPTTPMRWGDKKLGAALQSVTWEAK